MSCTKECYYDIRAVYADFLTLETNKRKQFRFDGHSTQIISNFIPSDTEVGLTRKLLLTIEAEEQEHPIEAILTFDDTFSLIEDIDYESTQLRYGKAFKMNPGQP